MLLRWASQSHVFLIGVGARMERRPRRVSGLALRVDKLALVLAMIEALAIHLGEVLCREPGRLVISIVSASYDSLVLVYSARCEALSC